MQTLGLSQLQRCPHERKRHFQLGLALGRATKPAGKGVYVDGSLYNHAPSERGAPQLVLIRQFWRMRSPNGRVLACGVYRTTAGMEVRCDFGGDDLIRSEFARDLGIASTIAEGWKMGALARVGFVELDEGTEP